MIQDLDITVEEEAAITIEATVEVGAEVDHVVLVSTTMRRQVRIHTTYASLVCLTYTCFIYINNQWLLSYYLEIAGNNTFLKVNNMTKQLQTYLTVILDSVSVLWVLLKVSW